LTVGKAKFIDRPELNCACAEGNTKVPLGVVSLSENLLIALMRAVLIVAG
jgi:hypothetical protein